MVVVLSADKSSLLIFIDGTTSTSGRFKCNESMSTNHTYTTFLDFDIAVSIITAQFLLLIVRIQQIQKLSLYL